MATVAVLERDDGPARLHLAAVHRERDEFVHSALTLGKLFVGAWIQGECLCPLNADCPGSRCILRKLICERVSIAGVGARNFADVFGNRLWVILGWSSEHQSNASHGRWRNLVSGVVLDRERHDGVAPCGGTVDPQDLEVDSRQLLRSRWNGVGADDGGVKLLVALRSMTSGALVAVGLRPARVVLPGIPTDVVMAGCACRVMRTCVVLFRL